MTELVHRLKQTENALARRRIREDDSALGSYTSKQPCTQMHGHTKQLRASTTAGHCDSDMTSKGVVIRTRTGGGQQKAAQDRERKQEQERQAAADAVLLKPPEGHDSLHQPSRLSALWCVRLCALCPCPCCVAELLHLAVRRLHSHDGHSCLR